MAAPESGAFQRSGGEQRGAVHPARLQHQRAQDQGLRRHPEGGEAPIPRSIRAVSFITLKSILESLLKNIKFVDCNRISYI